jgi:hypothetical protein
MIILVENKKSFAESEFSFIPGRNPPEKVIAAMVRKPSCLKDLSNYSSVDEEGIVLGTFIVSPDLWNRFTSNFFKVKIPSLEDYGGNAGNGFSKYVRMCTKKGFSLDEQGHQNIQCIYVNSEGFDYPRYAGFLVRKFRV